MTEKIDKKIIKKLDSKIINSITPFSDVSYKKKKEIDVFVGRENNLKSLTDSLHNTIFSDGSFGVSISGPGGCGKSTLFGYFMQFLNTQKIFLESYCRLKKEECEIITCFINAPKGEPTTLKYFWTSIIDALAEPNIEFLEKFATSLFRKCLDVLWKHNFKREELRNVFSILIPDFIEGIKHHDIVDLINLNKFFDFLISDEENVNKIKKIITSGWRILQRHEVSFNILGKVGDFNQKRVFKVEKQYFELLFDMLSTDYDKGSNAQDIFKGVKGDLIKSESDVIKLFKWLINTWEWVVEKPISFLIGVDNIGYMTVDLEDIESAYIPFIQTVLQIRDSLKKFLFVLIGTNEDWRLFNEYIKKHQDYRTQLRGFLINKIDLTRLTLTEVLEALSLIMSKFWTQAGVMHPSSSTYPFSNEFFTYLYEYHAHEYREILIYLDKIWSHYKSTTKVIELTDKFFMIKYVRFIMKEISQNQEPSIFSELYYSNLIEWEKKQAMSKFENIHSRHVGSTQSNLVERKLTEALRILQEKETPKQIDWAEKTPPITVETEKGKKTRYPDVYARLTRQGLSDRKRAFEIQVKMYDKNNFVKLTEIESSLELLERAYTDALLFAITGAGLEEKAIEKINSLNLNDRILYFKPFNEEQFKALSYLVYYEDITGCKLTVNVIKEIFEILFEENWDEILEQVRNIGSFRAKRILEKIKEKEKSTLTGYIEGSIVPLQTSASQTGFESVPKKEVISIKDNSNDIIKTPSGESISSKATQSKTGNLEVIINDLGFNINKNAIQNLHNRYQDSFKELKFVFDCINKRTERYKGKATKDYLKKRVPAHLSDENINELFLRLKNEDVKNQVTKEEKIFTYKGTSICITDIGKEFYQIIKKLENTRI